MSLLQHPDGVFDPNLQIWDNAAFDTTADAQLPLQPISLNCELNASKDKCGPAVPKKPLHDLLKKTQDRDVDNECIDAEIQAIEKEIGRLSVRLEVLRFKKTERDARRRGGRVVPAKFMVQESPAKKNLGTPVTKKIPESPAKKNLGTPVTKKIPESPARRGMSLGPVEIITSIEASSCRKSWFSKLEGIKEDEKKEVKKERERSSTMTPQSRPSMAKASVATTGSKKITETPADASKSGFRRRGISLGPSEIFAATNTATGVRYRSKNLETKAKMVKKEKEKEKGRSISSSPKCRRPSIAKVSELRQGVATVGSKKLVKKEEAQSMSLKPKALFQEAKSAKRPAKNAKVRIVPSRYSLAVARATGDEPVSKRRKWSLPESGKEEASVAESKRSLSLGESSKSPALEIPSKGQMEILSNESPTSIMKIAAMLPKIKTLRCTIESPRDSGCAKRIAELVRRKSHFSSVEEGEASASPCQSLNFEGEE